MSRGNPTRLPMLSAAIVLFLFIICCKSCGASDFQKQERDFSTLMEQSNWNARVKRHESDLASSNNLYLEERSVPSYGDFERNVTVQRGESAYLHCIVNNRGNNTVSWIRRKDMALLTLDTYQFISDQRFNAIYNANTNDWVLIVKYTQSSDAGVYECQVNSTPKVSSFTTLNVFIPKAVISGPPERYIKAGSEITLACVISQSSVQPTYIFWYQNDRLINYDTGTSTTNIMLQNMGDNTFISKLRIRDAHSSHSGDYKCRPSNADEATTKVYVL